MQRTLIISCRDATEPGAQHLFGLYRLVPARSLGTERWRMQAVQVGHGAPNQASGRHSVPSTFRGSALQGDQSQGACVLHRWA